MERESFLDFPPETYSAFNVNDIGLLITSSDEKICVNSSLFEKGGIELNVHLVSPRILTESDSESREKTTSFNSSSPLLETIMLALSIIPALNIRELCCVILELFLSIALSITKTFLASSILKTDSGGLGDIINPTEVSKIFLFPYASL